MSIFIASGSNLGNRLEHLDQAIEILTTRLNLIAKSRVYESPAVDYLNQPDFYNQVLEFQVPAESPEEIMDFLLQTEMILGRIRTTPKGPRVIDLDLLFWSDCTMESEKLILPHPRLFERSFVVLPLSELPGFKKLEQKFTFHFSFENSATPIS